MNIPSRSIKRRLRRTSFYAIPVIGALDILLFVALMLFKLILFDKLVHVPYMEMIRDDVMTAVGTLALASFWTLWLPARGRILSLIALDVVLTAVIYSDLIYFRYFQDLITVPVLMQAGQVGALGESIDSLLRAPDIGFFVDWIILVPIAVHTIYRMRKSRRSRINEPSYVKRSLLATAARRLGAGLAVFLIGFALVYVPVHKAKSTWAAELFTGNWWNMSLYNVTGVLGFHGYDLYRYANEHWLKDMTITAEQKEEAKRWFDNREADRKALETSDALYGRYNGSNVIVIQLEAFQNFVINRKIGNAEVTPNINKLLGTSLYFSNFYHQTSQGRTSDADLAANVSLQPLPTGSVFIRYAQHTYDSMPQTLKDHGYTANVFHAYDGGFWNRNMMYDQLGYDTFYSKNAFVIDEPLGWSLGDRSFFKQSVALMKKEKQPFYSFLISLTSHHPYALPKTAQTLDVGTFKGTIFGDYLEAVHYADAAIGVLVDELKTAGLWDRSIFMFYGDHDNSIREWEPFESFLGKSLNEADRFRILKGVPLVVHLPDDALAGTYGQVGGQLDVTPTALHLLGISSADKAMIGTPLITGQLKREEQQSSNKQVVFRNGAFTDGDVLYLPSEDGLPEHSKCYAFATGAAAADAAACQAGAAKAREELQASDLVVEHDLVPMLHEGSGP
ncbi:LTA synthase family protein [Paenibacillus montanisoli]|uniref:LTA synthase family protein n=1 Tax=Paenibacillus montanisoli TaxID=2081970 RepID=A0A328U919_9BACL|nr:LTA synthase family protein [Paenibacillus montanisoli]RAP77821.1 LTA synthase family protein [Paenibacillus montanisoli]